MRWTKAVPLKNMTHKEVILFILEHIVYRLGMPQMLTTDQGLSFMSHQVYEFTESLKSHLRSNYLVLHHTMLRPMVRPSLVTKL
jgi:hypothetical protein